MLQQAKTKLRTCAGDLCGNQFDGSGPRQTFCMLPDHHKDQATTVAPGMGPGLIRESGGCSTGKAQCLCFNKVQVVRAAAGILKCKWPNQRAYFSRSALPESQRSTSVNLSFVLIKHPVNKKLLVVYSKQVVDRSSRKSRISLNGLHIEFYKYWAL